LPLLDEFVHLSGLHGGDVCGLAGIDLLVHERRRVEDDDDLVPRHLLEGGREIAHARHHPHARPHRDLRGLRRPLAGQAQRRNCNDRGKCSSSHGMLLRSRRRCRGLRAGRIYVVPSNAVTSAR